MVENDHLSVHDDLSDSEYEDEVEEQQSSGPNSSTRKGNTVSLETFMKYSRFIIFGDNGTRARRRSTDKHAPIRDVWNIWVERLPLMYNISSTVTVDEQLVPFRGKCPFRQYIPSKPDSYGIKIWAACDAENSYLWNAEVYTGHKDESAECEQGKRIVLQLTEGLKGRNVTSDNFFCGLDLAKELKKRKQTIVGTIRKIRKELPVEFCNPKGMTRSTTLEGYYEENIIISYCPRKR
ncbi:piggyBac transposable element-derived protein 4-like [Palaemon carinicauda]|uniref:piggyBac transposable element-derived protein 4-like n=1 Tax=Palaemon carinicauda TaxID=392227 RepID=UPI0035B68042